MKSLFLFTLFVSLLFAQERPKIALVLSGGGARGGAHVGVLKVLEENKVPIDMIIGTSMGSFVGALYAAGQSPQEIATMLETTDWEEYINSDFDRQDIPMRKKDIDYTYPGRLGIGVNADNKLVLPTGVLKRELLLLKFMELTSKVQDVNDFDKLSIPYRAVATNIKNGEAVVLKSGSLAKAIYASSSIPGGFQPININGIDLVDGGVSDNLPINVAKEMGADIIIAVDVSEPFKENIDVNSYFVVMGQLVDILMRKNANESIEKLSEQDILITPDLKGYSGLDADKYKEIIQKGIEAAQKVKDALQKLSLDKEFYAKYYKTRRVKKVYHPPVIDDIVIVNPTYLADESIRRRIHQKVGEALDDEQLRKDLLHLYHMMIFDSVDYEVKKIDGKNTLFIQTTPSWDNHGEIRFAIGFEDDFKGHSSYSIKLGYTMFGLNKYGGEWKSDFEIGRYQKAYTEIFQPLDTMQRYYVKPSVYFESVTDVFPLQTFANQELYSSRYGGALAFGAHIGTALELELSLAKLKDGVRVDSLGFNKNYDAMPLKALINIDNLDNVNFPQKGVKSQLRWTKELKSMGSDYDYEQLYFDVEKPLRFYSNNITLFVKYGETYKRDDATLPRLSGLFTLGGLFNLSGYQPYSFVGDNIVFGALKYTYEVKDGGFFGSLNAPLYLGFSLEAGNTWDYDQNLNYDRVKKSATIYAAADTFLGPLYLAYGQSAEGENSVYLYLGEKF